MAPNFFSKLVKSPSGAAHTRDRSDRSSESRRSPSPAPRSRTVSAITPPSSNFSSVSGVVTAPNIRTEPPGDSSDTNSNPSVTVVPPSPLSTTDSSSLRKIEGLPHVNGDDSVIGSMFSTRSRSLSSPAQARATEIGPIPPVPQIPSSLSASPETSSRPPSRPNTASSSKSNMREAFISAFGGKDPNASPTPELRTKTSNKSLKNLPPPIATAALHSRAATTPNMVRAESNDSSISETSIVESPTSIIPPEFPSSTSHPPTNGKPQLSASPTRNGDAITAPTASAIKESGSDNKKKPKWKRPTQKPTGLASAIAASGLAMANPMVSAQHQAHHQAQLSPPVTSRKATLPSPPYLNRAGSGSAVSATGSSHTRMGSTDFSPKSKASKKRGSSVHSDHSEYFPENPTITSTDYYSGLEDDSSDEDDDSDDDDVLLDLDLAGNEIPVTGFAVASSRRNADFHELFPTIPEGDYLIEDYGCALQREILIQGRLYISENHICFHANIFGWITDLSIPIYEITSLEKKMTAFVIPNAIQITTRQNKYSFTSFLSRDTTFDVIYNIWRLARPEDANSIGSGSGAARSMDQIVEGTIIGSGREGQVVVGGTQVGSMKKRVTTCQCGKNEKHYSEKALDMIVPGTPEKIYGLMFASGFMKDFMVVDQKLLDIQVSDWAPIQAGSKLLARNMSYIKPLNGAVGPKQTKCEIRDETEHCDFEDYISTVTTTRTPDVPSGGVFSVKTRTCIMWASQMSTKVVVTTQVEWTGRSFIKGIIERSAIDGQKVYHTALEKGMRGYIKDHQTEFVPEGVDPAAIAPEEGAVSASPDEASAAEPDLKQLEHERNQRAFQWAWDTFEGTMSVARQSVKGALELIREAWDQSTSTTILYFIIVFLVISNIYTLIRMGKKEELGRRKALKMTDEKWIHGVVTALWDELSAGKGVPGGVGVPPMHGAPSSLSGDQREFDAGNIGEEIIVMARTLDEMEVRLRTLKESLHGLVHDISDSQLD